MQGQARCRLPQAGNPEYAYLVRSLTTPHFFRIVKFHTLILLYHRQRKEEG